MSVRKVLLLAICLMAVNCAFASEAIKVRHAVGKWEVSNDITPKQAEEKALFEAKKEALRKAGVMENVWSVFGQITSDSGSEFVEAYSAVSTLAINGMVNVTDMKVEDLWDPGLKRDFKVVTIDAIVTADDTKEDKTYALEVKGIEPVYKEGETFECTFSIYGHDSYLKFFWFGENGAALIYPNEYEGNQIFKAGQKYHMPVTTSIDMVMQKHDANKDVEKVNIIAVATKKDYPYLGKYDYQSIIQWVYGLPADQRTLFYTLTLIK